MNSDDLRAAGNPFPRTAVAIAPGKELPNYFTESQAQGVALVQKFADRFASPIASGGIAIGIRGAVGSGKTHTLFQLQDKLAELLPSSKRTYAKALNARTIVDFYSGVFAGNLLLDDFRNLASQHFLKLLKGKTQSVASTTDLNSTLMEVAAEQAAISLQRGDQQYLLTLIEADLIPTAELKAERERDIQASEHLLLGDLALAYSKILDPTYGMTAVEWLQGKPLTDQQMRDLGLRSRIATIPDAQQAFKFLLEAYRRADVPLMLSIDEFERSVLTDAGEPDVTGRNLLKDIAEAVVLGGHLFVACGLRSAWDSLSADFFGRISKTDVVDMSLTAAEAEELIHTWERGAPSVFSGAALSMAAEVAEYNSRRLLEIAHHSWEIWSATQAAKALPEDVRKATRRVLGDSKRRQDALSAISKFGELNGIVTNRNSRLSEYDLMLGPATSPLAFVKVTASVFKDDEVEDIRQLIEARHRVVKDYPTAGTCTVIAGYSSPAIVEELRRAGDYVIRFDEPEFGAAFGGFISATRERSSVLAAPLAREDDGRYAVLLSKVDVIAEQNRAQIEELRRSFAAVKEQKVQRVEERFAKSSADKLKDVLEELTSLLEEENELLFGRFSPDGLEENYSKQRSRLQYAKFLDRVVPESHMGEYLTHYELKLDKTVRVDFFSASFHDQLRDLYSCRLEILRDMREASAGRRPVFNVLRSMITVRSVAATIGVLCLVTYVVVLVESFYSDSGAVRTYIQQVERLQDFAVQHRNWPVAMVPLNDFTTLLSGFTTSRAAFRSTPFLSVSHPRRGASAAGGLDEALSNTSSAIACMGLPAQSNACRERDVSESLDALRKGAEDELGAVPDPSIALYVPLYVVRTWPWFLVSLLLTAPYVAWRIRRGLRRPQAT
jgi:Cdc6-like AAA superfamily ATPase